MGCDYYTITDIVVVYKTGKEKNYEYNIEHGYCGYFLVDDSDEELSVKEYIDRYCKNTEKILMENGCWLKQAYRNKYIHLIKDEDINIIEKVYKDTYSYPRE